MFAEDGHLSQYSKTSFRMWGTKATWPLAGLERNMALRRRIMEGKRRSLNSFPLTFP